MPSDILQGDQARQLRRPGPRFAPEPRLDTSLRLRPAAAPRQARRLWLDDAVRHAAAPIVPRPDGSETVDTAATDEAILSRAGRVRTPVRPLPLASRSARGVLVHGSAPNESSVDVVVPQAPRRSRSPRFAALRAAADGSSIPAANAAPARPSRSATTPRWTRDRRAEKEATSTTSRRTSLTINLSEDEGRRRSSASSTPSSARIR